MSLSDCSFISSRSEMTSHTKALGCLRLPSAGGSIPWASRGFIPMAASYQLHAWENSVGHDHAILGCSEGRSQRVIAKVNQLGHFYSMESARCIGGQLSSDSGKRGRCCSDSRTTWPAYLLHENIVIQEPTSPSLGMIGHSRIGSGCPVILEKPTLRSSGCLDWVSVSVDLHSIGYIGKCPELETGVDVAHSCIQ